MVLVDTSIWVDFLNIGDPQLAELLEASEARSHPYIVGELACGSIKNRKEILDLMASLDQVPKATDEELLVFLEKRKLYGKGLSLIDVHLLASGVLGNCPIWTKDKHLRAVAEKLGVVYEA